MAEDPYKYFRVEAQELLGQLQAGALALEKPGANAELVARLLRHAHTLKGAARVVKQIEMADAAHAFEELLAPHRQLSAPWPAGQNDALLAELDTMSALLARLNAAPAAPPPTAAKHTSPTPASSAEERARTLRADVSELDSVLDGVGETLAELSSLRAVLDGELDQMRKLGELYLRQLSAPRKQDVRQLERALERTKGMTEDMLLALRRLDGRMGMGLDRALRELAEVRGTAERLRLVPAQLMFTALERAVRDAARELDKQVQFEAHGGETRLDGAALELVQSALLHVVRNAVAHGIEPAAQRARRGKPALGRVRLQVARRSGRVAFVCEDDGQGVDVAAVRAALPDAGAAQLSDAEVLERLIHAGISTASRVTSVSGRGVGLDVLREAAERLGGEVTLSSEPERGLRVELLVPVSAAALMGLMVESGGTTAALPLDAVERCVRLERGAVARGMDGESVMHDGKVIPFMPLSRSLHTRESPSGPGHKAHSAVVLRAGSGQRLAVGVDRVLGTRMVVLRRMPPLAAATGVVAGAALNAAGKPELVLDPDGLVQSARARSSLPQQPAAASQRVLVVDDSLTTRMLEQSILESAGYQVDLAASGEEGLQKARAYRYGVILCDVEMPGIDGFTFVEQVRKDPELKGIPAVLVSSRSDPEDLQRGQAVGASGYIVKGRFDQRELLQMIRNLMGGG